ncbi:hypothetical protein MRB53_006490 [Persea americana]|uniref:Uncharacterized protein n=1 Tax=Persea americana TaxID=3435 RepID=A0ACC2MG58_PERAE|nr:hypothetical protein MRB53_006490 [Persea americana]
MRSIGVRKRSLMNEANINPSRVLEDEQDDEKVTRSIGIRKRLFVNEADINPSIVLEGEQDNEKMEVTNYRQAVPRLKCFLDLLIASLDPVFGMLLYRLRVPKSILVFNADNDLGADLKLLMTYYRPWNA